MKCPDMKSAVQSLGKGEQRIKKAVNALGTDVMAKICSVALYSLGYSYEGSAKDVVMNCIHKLKAICQNSIKLNCKKNSGCLNICHQFNTEVFLNYLFYINIIR